MSAVKQACFEALEVGQSYTAVNVVSREDVVKFSEVTGDVNPLHLDEAYARNSIFGECIAHGMISACYISAIFGTRFPGAGSIFLSQSLKFIAPVTIGATVQSTVTITGLNKKRNLVTLDCVSKVGDKVVLGGEARLMVPNRQTNDGQTNDGQTD
ncbi:MAG: MaoC family dehydratase [Alphaproteobacteria bacterium]|nr:MaoC family dehydratase [Alphaproteobacteria bacterium]